MSWFSRVKAKLTGKPETGIATDATAADEPATSSGRSRCNRGSPPR